MMRLLVSATMNFRPTRSLSTNCNGGAIPQPTNDVTYIHGYLHQSRNCPSLTDDQGST